MAEGEEEPVKASFADRPAIPRKRERPTRSDANCDVHRNGKRPLEATAEPGHQGTKRSHSEYEGQPAKKSKTTEPGTNPVVVVEDGGGAIVIDDD